MIKFKLHVQLGLVPEIWGALFIAEKVFAALASADVIVTSGREGQHILTSLHQVGRAVDLRLKHIPQDRWEAMYQALKDQLPQYLVLLEVEPPATLVDTSQWAPHLHIGYKGVVA